MSLTLGLWLVGVVACDFARRRVPNRWVMAGAVFAIVALAVGRSPLAVSWPDALLGGIGAFLILLCFYAMGLMGAGDVKFAGVLGLWVGGSPLLPIVMGAGLLAGGHALFSLIRHHGPWKARADAKAPSAAVPRARASIPYAGYLALMALVWLALRLEPASH